jgi:hypothetical protein
MTALSQTAASANSNISQTRFSMSENFFSLVAQGLPQRGYYTSHNLTFYVSRKHLNIGGQLRDFLTIGNISVDTEVKQGQGNYTAFLQRLEAELPDKFYGICIECILTDRFADFHLRQGYSVHGPSEYTVTVTKAFHAESQTRFRRALAATLSLST